MSEQRKIGISSPIITDFMSAAGEILGDCAELESISKEVTESGNFTVSFVFSKQSADINSTLTLELKTSLPENRINLCPD
jgi:hypothetical protein